MTNKKVVVGLDHGNGWVKAKMEGQTIVLPSYFSRMEDLGEDMLGASLDVKIFESASNKGEEYVWGKDINQLEKHLATYGSQDRYKQKYFKLLNEFAIAELILNNDYDGDTYDVWVITGVPSREKGTNVEEDLEDSLMGAHIVKVNGEDIVFKVTKVVILPQPVGTLMSMYLDSEGFVANEDYESTSVAIIDIGTGTTDLDHIKSLRRQESDSYSLNLGMFDVYKKIETWIKKQNPSANVTVQKVEAQFDKDSYMISKRSVLDIREIKEKAIDEVAMDIKNAIIQQWKTWERFDEIIITGGGSSTLGVKIKELIDDVVPSKNAQTANADGFCKYGKYLQGVRI